MLDNNALPKKIQTVQGKVITSSAAAPEMGQVGLEILISTILMK